MFPGRKIFHFPEMASGRSLWFVHPHLNQNPACIQDCKKTLSWPLGSCYLRNEENNRKHTWADFHFVILTLPGVMTSDVSERQKAPRSLSACFCAYFNISLRTSLRIKTNFVKVSIYYIEFSDVFIVSGNLLLVVATHSMIWEDRKFFRWSEQRNRSHSLINR